MILVANARHFSPMWLAQVVTPLAVFDHNADQASPYFAASGSHCGAPVADDAQANTGTWVLVGSHRRPIGQG